MFLLHFFRIIWLKLSLLFLWPHPVPFFHLSICLPLPFFPLLKHNSRLVYKSQNPPNSGSSVGNGEGLPPCSTPTPRSLCVPVDQWKGNLFRSRNIKFISLIKNSHFLLRLWRRMTSPIDAWRTSRSIESRFRFVWVSSSLNEFPNTTASSPAPPSPFHPPTPPPPAPSLPVIGSITVLPY